MKKLLAALLVLAMLASSALAEGAAVDVDFTQMDAQSAIDALYDMMDAPEENQGRTARLRGNAYCIDATEDEDALYFLTIDDPAASCCGGVQIEFLPSALPSGIDAFALDGEEVTVTGTLDFGDDDGYMDLRLLNAEVILPII